jgi:hypothetical protein
MSKYRKLTLHLAQLDRNEWRARFEEIEAILGFRLCKSARSYQPWWANHTVCRGRQCAAWQSIGWRTRDLDLAKGRVTFFRREPRLHKQHALSAEVVP